MNKNFSITIGIPAFNEQENIKKLLKQVLRQKVHGGNVNCVVVASDGSSDNTTKLVKGFKDKRVNIIESKKRRGKAYRQNQIIEKTKSDILVLLDADTSIKDPLFIEKLVAPIQKGLVDFTSSQLKELPVRSFFEKVLDVSMQLKNVLFASYKNGNNIYNCHGLARAFNKKSFKLLNFIESDGEDMYSYLACVKKGMKFLYVPEAVIEYRLPSNLKDHMKQSTRFFVSGKMYEKYFNSGFGKREFTIPEPVYFKAFLKALPIIAKNFIYVCVYVFVLGYTKFIGMKKKYNETWQIASSKKL